MINVMFVCLGNICRSPMAEAVFTKMVQDEGLALSFNISSGATSDCEEGNFVYPPAQRLLREKGYNYTHRARQISLRDIRNVDYVLIMDSINERDIRRICGGQCLEKIKKLGNFLPQPIDIADPWYTGDFERTYKEIYSSCVELLKYLKIEHANAFEYDSRH